MDSRGGVTGFGSFRGRLAGALVACALLACCSAPAALARVVVSTDKGAVKGIEAPTTKQYLGIPYAAPPVGDLRWMPPEPAARWHGLRETTQFGNHCPQTGSPFGFRSDTEDCLYLNVFTPNTQRRRGDDDDEQDDDDHEGRKAKRERGSARWRRGGRARRGGRSFRGRHGKRRPVMVWLHGGALTVGESDDYDPTRLVEQGVVVVTINYRIGYLGFLSHPALSAESEAQASGNYGLMDQQAALRWVERNIKQFGGNPRNVTIFGESAGGLSVHSQLASPLAEGLFDKAIVQSGAYELTHPSLAQAEARGSALAGAVGCADQSAACLRGVSVASLLANQPTLPGALGPNVDGHVLPTSVKAALESGQFNRVPVVEGSTHDEFSLFYATNVEFVFGVLPKDFYPIIVSTLVSTLGLNTTAVALQTEYPIDAYSSVAEAVTAIGTDAIFACPGRRAAQAASRFVPAYAYEFNDPNAPQPFLPPMSIPYRAFHASELASLFDSFNRGGHAPFDADQEALAAAMVRYWTQFARSGDPNTRSTPDWPAYTEASDTYQSLAPPTPQPTTGFAADHHCAFWDAL